MSRLFQQTLNLFNKAPANDNFKYKKYNKLYLRIKMFGPHLMLDLYECNKKKTSDPVLIPKLLNELPSLINMHKISEPSVTIYPGKTNSFDKGGISAFILIAESHITIHTFVEQKYVSVDIFSCKDFDVKKVEEYFVKNFEAEKIEKNFIMRGREFPKNIEKAKPIVLRQRGRIGR